MQQSAMSSCLSVRLFLQHFAVARWAAGYVAENKLVWPWEDDTIRQKASGGRVARSSEKGGANALSKKTGDASDEKN